MVNRVFFLGAGFSKAIDNDYPLMCQLTAYIEEKILKLSIADSYKKMPSLIKENVESLLTYLSTDYPWKTDITKYYSLALYEKIVKLISKKFYDLAKESVKQTELNGIAKDLAEYVSIRFDECNFITLNYDLLLEKILLSGLKKYNISEPDFYQYPMAWIGRRNQESRSGFLNYADINKSDNIPAVLKLHGSANWFWAGISPSDIIYYRNWNQNEKDNMDMGLKPYIIPPVMDKNAFYNNIAIRALWQQAKELLKAADEIYIIGFSFPQTDLSVKYLFQSALKQSNAKIYVVNPEAEKNLRINYDKVFGNNENIIYEYSGEPDVTEHFIIEHLLSKKENSK